MVGKGVQLKRCNFPHCSSSPSSLIQRNNTQFRRLCFRHGEVSVYDDSVKRHCAWENKAVFRVHHGLQTDQSTCRSF